MTNHPRVLTVTQHDIDQCPVRSLQPRHYRRDGTCEHRSSHATDAFNMNWQNDYDLYQAVLRLGRQLLRVLGEDVTSPQVVGEATLRLLRPRAEAAAAAHQDNLWAIMHRDVEHWDEVDPVAVGTEVLEALEVES
jgi:hypothetical protein